MIRLIVITAVLCFASLVELGNGYRILGVFPTPSVSHQVVFRGLTLALNKRGHELVVVTTDPINDPNLKNYTEIDISPTYDMTGFIDFIEYRSTTSWLEILPELDFLHLLSEYIFDHPEMRELYVSNCTGKFDLMLVETLYSPAILPLAQRFNVPVVGITSLGLPTVVQYAIGNPVMPSHLSNWELESMVSKHMSFWQRLENFVKVWKHVYWFHTTYAPVQQAIARKYLGNDIADLAEYEKNVSLIFVNQQGPISYGRPNVPNVIEIGGFHVLKQATVLPKNLQQILDRAVKGFIYISLGSNVKSVMLPNETVTELIGVFSRLPYQVLWKFEKDALPNKPDNVHIMKWVPQQAVLAHPNLKVFIYQGGLQSTEEAIANGIPLIGFPVFADQDMQVNKMVSLGVALKLEITAVDGNELFQAISTIATDPSYKQRMLNLRSLIGDRPHDPLENAVWWTEYVIRHKGAPHLRSSTADQPWYQRQDVDIVAFISSVFTIVSLLALYFLNRLFNLIGFSSTKTLDLKMKIN